MDRMMDENANEQAVWQEERYWDWIYSCMSGEGRWETDFVEENGWEDN